MTARALRFALLAVTAAGLAGCTTGGGLPPTQVVRYHLDQTVTRGTISIQPLTPDAAGSSLSFAPYSAAIQQQLNGLGYTPAGGAGVLTDFVALVDLKQDQQFGPPRRSPVSIGLGAGGYSGGWHGGTGVGGGVSFPIGGGGRRAVLVSELSVTIKRRADQSAVWEGHARSIVDARSPAASADAQANRLAAALFAGFPGESGRTIEVK